MPSERITPIWYDPACRVYFGAILNLPLEKVTKEGNGPEGILIVSIDIVSPLASYVVGNVYDKTELTSTA